MSDGIRCAMMLLGLLARLAATVLCVVLTVCGISVVGRLLASGSAASLVVVGLLAVTALWTACRGQHA